MDGINPRSTARIGDHPIHPMLVPFPIAFFVGTLGCDLACWQTGVVFCCSDGSDGSGRRIA